MPYEECAVDLIGPWTIQVRDKPYEFNALTMIDTVSNLVELVRIDDKTSARIAKKYGQVWLTQYPWPAHCIHDNGGEYIGPEFSTLGRSKGLEIGVRLGPPNELELGLLLSFGLAGNVGNVLATCQFVADLDPTCAPDTCLTTFCCRGMPYLGRYKHYLFLC
jgi:hypothetical protein